MDRRNLGRRINARWINDRGINDQALGAQLSGNSPPNSRRRFVVCRQFPGCARDQLQVRNQIRASGTRLHVSFKRSLKGTVRSTVKEFRQNSLHI
jgi:hypothetical protein